MPKKKKDYNFKLNKYVWKKKELSQFLDDYLLYKDIASVNPADDIFYKYLGNKGKIKVDNVQNSKLDIIKIFKNFRKNTLIIKKYE